MQRDRIKLLHFLTDFNIGGTERQVLNLVKGLDSARFHLHLACFRRRGSLLNEVEGIPAAFRDYEIDRFADSKTVRVGTRFVRDLRKQQIQIVHTYGFYANVFAVPAARLARTPVIVASIRDLGDYLTPAQRRVQKLVCRLADCVLVNAEAIRQNLISRGYDAEKIEVIPNGIAFSRFESGNDGSLRSELGLPPSTPLVAVVSRLNRLKGIDCFLEASAIVARDFPQARFLFVGDGVGRPEFERYASNLGLAERVIFTGFRTDVPKVLSQITVSVLPSLSEGLSNSLLESMAAGVPVVATRVGGNPEVVEDGVTGLLVEAKDPAALAQAIGRLLQDQEMCSRMSCAGREHVVQRFSVSKMVEATERLYVEMAERGQDKVRRGGEQVCKSC